MKKRMFQLPLKMGIILLLAISTTAMVTARTLGDANRSGTIDIIDALIVAQYCVGFNPQPFDAWSADVDGSGDVAIIDALIIAQYYVGIISEFPYKPVTPGPTPQPTVTMPDVDYQALIQRWAESRGIDLTHYRIVFINAPSVAEILPGYLFCKLGVRQYPVMAMPDKILGVNSIVAINTKLELELLTDEPALERFYKLHQIPATTRENMTLAMQAWLNLSQYYKNDGYYTFVIPVKEITITQVDNGPSADKVIYQVVGVCRVAAGGEGAIVATALIPANGILLSLSEKVELIEGVRPICQSSKLLDADPVVRKMAEQDLLVMGVKASAYLFEQRKKSPADLQQAIDRLWTRILEREVRKEKIRQLLN